MKSLVLYPKVENRVGSAAVNRIGGIELPARLGIYEIPVAGHLACDRLVELDISIDLTGSAGKYGSGTNRHDLGFIDALAHGYAFDHHPAGRVVIIAVVIGGGSGLNNVMMGPGSLGGLVALRNYRADQPDPAADD